MKHKHVYDSYDELVEEEYCKCGDKRIRPITAKPQHTPTPFELGHLNQTKNAVYDSYGKLVCDCTTDGMRTAAQEKANAAYIVRAVNCHSELVDALANALETIKALDEDYDLRSSYCDGKQAIARAERK